MTAYILRRILYMLVVLLVVSGITFALMHAVPGGPFDGEKKLPPEIEANKEKYYHLDDPLYVQYISYLIAVIIGMPLGILSALNHNRWPDYLGMGVAIFGVSVPTIVLAPTLVWIFGVSLKWLPPTGWGAKPPFMMGLFPSHLGWDY